MTLNDKEIKLQVFESALWDSYQRIFSKERTLYVSLHRVMERVGLPLDLFNERLQELWNKQFTSESKYTISLEPDATPTEYYRLRKKHIIIDNCPMFIIQMTKRKED
jgi:hypothetical protein